MQMPAKKLGLGFMRLPLTDANNQKAIDMPQVEQMVDKFLQRGFTYCDTAWMYHDFMSEEAVGKAVVDRYPRNTFTIATKMPDMMLKSREQVPEIFEKQKEKLHVSYFDYYLAHDMNHVNYEKAKKYGAIDFLRKKREEGEIKCLGFSFHDTPEVLESILDENPFFEFVQLQINYLDWESAGIQSHRCYDVAAKHGLPVIVMEPVKGGNLAHLPYDAAKVLEDLGEGASQASYALRYVASFPQIVVTLSGMSNMDQMRDNVSFMKDFHPLDEKELEAINKVKEIFKSKRLIACTGCSYCTDGCPMQISIPDMFADLNAKALHKNWNSDFYFMVHTQGRGKPSDCIECGQCESVCPQHLPIIETLKKAAKAFEK